MGRLFIKIERINDLMLCGITVCARKNGLIAFVAEITISPLTLETLTSSLTAILVLSGI